MGDLTMNAALRLPEDDLGNRILTCQVEGCGATRKAIDVGWQQLTRTLVFERQRAQYPEHHFCNQCGHVTSVVCPFEDRDFYADLVTFQAFPDEEAWRQDWDRPLLLNRFDKAGHLVLECISFDCRSHGRKADFSAIPPLTPERIEAMRHDKLLIPWVACATCGMYNVLAFDDAKMFLQVVDQRYRESNQEICSAHSYY